MIYRKKKLFNDVPNFKIRKLNFQSIQRSTRMVIGSQSHKIVHEIVHEHVEPRETISV